MALTTAEALVEHERPPAGAPDVDPRRAALRPVGPALPLLGLTPDERPPQVVHVERLPARSARFGRLHHPLPPAVAERVPFTELWTHQVEAIDLARSGRSVVVATGTASGKSLCYQLPIAEAVTDSPGGTALLLFPTKALAHDQLRSLTDLDVPDLVAGAYDGDCGHDERVWLRSHANVLLTNPEMLHHGILPQHGRWATFLGRLRYVVVDELHVLRGIFGTHVAHLLRRLRRLCAHYGAEPTFVFSSATIGAPGRLAADLCGLPVATVDDDGSPRGERTFVLWNPAAAEGDRSPSANRDTAALVADLIGSGHRTIAFCRSRKGTEVVAADVRRRLPDHHDDAVRPYRGGYLAAERRAIEDELATGRLQAVVATTALELGVDIGGLDACVLNGFPGTISSMWQQAGRAGRTTEPSVTVLVAGDDQLDQWLMAHPDQVFARPPEPAVINTANPFILVPQLACATYERPLGHRDERYWPDVLDDGVRALALDDAVKLRRRDDGPVAVWAGDGWPADLVGLRSGASREVRIALADGTLVGTVDSSRACRLTHPGAIYLHQGQPSRVVTLDFDDLAAIVEPTSGDEYTQPRSETSISVLAEDTTREVGRARLSLGEVEVVSRVVGYKRFETLTGELLGTEELFLPPSELVTRGFWYAIPDGLLDDAQVLPPAVPGALHAVEHAAIGILPLFTICDRWDVGGVSIAFHPDVGEPAIFVYDGYPGGAGIAELGFEAADRHLHTTLEVIEACPCADGCPSCVQSPKCGNGNDPHDKAAAARLLRTLLA
jgi:DEAD/DEAH box helicase domain-containing protein